MAHDKHPTLVLAVTIVLATALASSCFGQAAGRGGTPGGGPGGGRTIETQYPGNENCVVTRCTDDQRRKAKAEHSDRCSPAVLDAQRKLSDCHPQQVPKP